MKAVYAFDLDFNFIDLEFDKVAGSSAKSIDFLSFSWVLSPEVTCIMHLKRDQNLIRITTKKI